MALWERSASLTDLEELFRATATSGRIALVAGEAGIGKSTLVNAFVERLGSRARLLLGRCDPLTTPRAAGPLHDIARQAGGALAERVATGAGQAEVFAALLDEVSGPAARARRVVIIEDLHWADEATHDLLMFLGRRIDRLPVLLMATYRDDEVGPEHPLRATLSTLPRAFVTRILVPPLSHDCVAEQAAAAGHDPDDVFERTGGNPLLVTEVLAAADRSVPMTVRDLVLARLAGLSSAGRDVARLVSVLPTGAEEVVLRGLEAAVDECLASGVLRVRDDVVGYRHELLRQAVEDSLSPARLVGLHRRVLTALAAAGGVDPARLVHHARRAGEVDALLAYGRRAATEAAAQGAHREALAHYRVLRPHVARLSPAERADLLEAYAVEAYLSGVPVEGLDVRRAALAEREQLGQPVRVGENLRWISRLAWWSGRADAARKSAARAVAVLEAQGPTPALAMAYSNRSQLHMLAGDTEEAIRWGERARALAEEVGDEDTAIHAAVNVSTARFHANPATAAIELRAAHEAADRAGLVDHAARALNCLATSFEWAGRIDEAVAVVEDALAYASEHDLPGYEQHLLGNRAGLRLERCDWDGALEDAAQALARPDRTGIGTLSALVVQGRIQAARGDQTALSILDRAAEYAAQTAELQRIGPVAAARAEYHLLAGEPDLAAAAVAAALELAVAKRQASFAGPLAHLHWRATGEFLVTDPSPYRSLAEGDWAAAAAAFGAGGRQYTRIAALSTGDSAAAAEALARLAELGADRAVARLRAELKRRGLDGLPRGPRRTTVANAVGLTARQLEILRLLADGLSNADIAQRLTLSHRTVEHHVTATLEKLGARRRGEAVAVARRLGVLA